LYYSPIDVTVFDALLHETGYALRTLRKSLGFTLVAVLTLACGIGATTAAFTQIYAVFYKEPPVRDVQALRALSYRDPRRPGPTPTFSSADYVHLRDTTRTFSDLACWSTGSMQPLGERGPLNLQFVSANYFRTLGVEPALGRGFTREDDRPGATPVAMLSYRVWQRDFGADAAAIHQTLRIQGAVFDIVGVLPRGFYGLDPTAPHDVMVPHALVPLVRPGNPSCRIVGRLQAATPAEAARVEVDRLFRESPAKPRDQQREGMPVALSPVEFGGGPAGLRERTAPSLRVLMAMTALVMLIACANVAGLMLVRAAARTRDVGTMLALGATRARVARQLLLESLVLAVTSGALGVALAYALNPVLPAFIVELGGVATLTGEGMPLGVDVSPDRWVLGFGALLTACTAVAAGIVPILRASRVDVVGMIRQTAAIRSRSRLLEGGAALTAVQVALSMVLLIGVGLFARTLVNLNAVPVGYQPRGMLFATLNPINRPRAFVDDAMRKMEALPGVTTVAASQWPLFNNAEPKLPVCIQGGSPQELRLDIEWATPRYFETWGVSIVQGTDFAAGGSAQAIVNRTFAARFFPGQAVVGRSIGVGQCPGRPAAIVGVVADHLDRQRADLLPMVYLPYPAGGAFNPTTIALRVDGDARAFVPAVRRIIAGLDSSLADGDVTTGVDYRKARVRRELILASLLGVFGTLALVMSCLGIYGTVAYAVTRRTRELGIRTALGARWPQIVRSVAGRYGAAVVAGVAAGTAAAIPLSSLVEALLFRVSSADGWTIAGATLVIALAAALAAMRPAWRAATLNPIEALRVE
jgi:predicted permease